MRTAILKRAGRASGPKPFARQLRSLTVMVASLLATFNLSASPVVTTLGGGNPNVKPKYLGYQDGNTLRQALFHTPCGIALDSTGQYLYVADRDNSKVRILELDDPDSPPNGSTWTFDVTYTNLINKPIAVAVDSDDYVYVLNRGNVTNGSVVTFDNWGDAVITNAVQLTNAAGMALDSAGNIYLTVQSNKLVRIAADTTSLTTITANFPAGTSLQGIVVKQNGLIAACDSGRNGIYLIDPSTGVVTTNAGFHGTGDFNTNGNNIASSTKAMFNQPMCVVETGDGTLIVTDNGNNRVKAVLTSGVVTNLYGVTSKYWGGSYPGWYDGTVSIPDSIKPNVQSRLPFGIAMAADGSLYTTEDYYHIIRHVTGAGLMPPVYPPPLPAGLTATAGYGQVVLQWSASFGATYYNIIRSTSSGGPFTNTLASATATTYTDTNVVDGTTYYYVVSAANTGGESATSSEVNATPLFSPTPTILSVTTNYGQINLIWSVSAGATSYNVKRSHSSGGPYTTIAQTASTGYTDTNVINGTTYYYVVSALNPGGESTNSAEVSATPPLPPVPDPEIGWVDFPPFNIGSVFHNDSAYVFNNDVPIVIVGAAGSQAFYTYGATPDVGSIPDPTTNSFSAPVGYVDGLYPDAVALLTVASIMPDLTIKAIGTKIGGYPNSSIVQARFQFVTANPLVIGNNAGFFALNDITAGCTFWYSIDGTDPTNSAGTTNFSHSIFLGTNSLSLTNFESLPITSNFTFKVRAFKNNYQPSGVVSAAFSATNFVPNSISFGFASGEASSDFVASPGQTFYAPVTLSPLPNAVMYSLQFNLTVTNGGPNPGPAIAPGAFNFVSMLWKPIPGESDVYEPIPPWIYEAYAVNPPPGPLLTLDGNPAFVSLMTTNLADNLLGVGWVERLGATNLYDTKAQDLIQFSMAHDDMFFQAGGQVIVGGFNFLVPTNAGPGQTYQIQIGRPSATSDGIGAPGSSVFIFAPTNGSLGGGAINSIKNVTMGQRTYLVGNVYPFRWFNAGDFGNTNLQSADVEQVFELAVYGLDYTPAGSDLFDAMDSCGGTYVDLGHGYLELNTTVTDPNALNALFNGNDTTINQIAFGDGVIDICDVYVTYRRSLDPTLTWFQRFWTNGVRVAQIVPNTFNPGAVSKPLTAAKASSLATNSSTSISITNQPKVVFIADDVQTNAGSTISIPITASIFGNYPLRLLMLGLTVVPLDGSPALTTPVSFSYNPALGSPWTTEQRGNGNYSAAWLNSTISGLSNTVSLGTLTVTIPTNATSLSAYAVHFDHASASPNGLASFPKSATTGLITLSDRSSSSWGDAIPDSWRLRYFLTLNNLLSATNADADGDGVNNLQEYLAGTDPTDPTSFFKNIGTDPSAAQSSQDCVISWPSVIGKQYVIERSPSLSTPIWSIIATNSGNGTTMEYHDTTGGGVRFYRVSVQ